MISGLILLALSQFVDAKQVWQSLQGADFRYLPLAIIALLASLFARSMAWRTLLEDRVEYQQLFFILNIGYLLNNIVSRFGDIGRALLLNGSPNLSFWQGLSTILVERAFDVLIMAGMLLVTLPFVIGAAWVQPVALGLGGGVVLGIVFLHLLARNRQKAAALLQRGAERWAFLSRLSHSAIEPFFDGLSALVSPVRFLRTLFWMLLAWALIVSEYYLLLKAFLPQVQWLWAAFGVGVVSLSVILPSSPGFLGVVEGAVVAAFALFNIDSSTALAYAITAHGLYLIITIILGWVGLIQQGESLALLVRKLQQKIPKKGLKTEGQA